MMLEYNVKLNDSFNNIDICYADLRRSEKLGHHPFICYFEPFSCSSQFLKLSILAAHFPNLRSIKNLIYTS